MLDLLASKKVLDDPTGGATGLGGRKAKKGFTFDPSNFSFIDLSAELAKNVDMKPEIISIPLPMWYVFNILSVGTKPYRTDFTIIIIS